MKSPVVLMGNQVVGCAGWEQASSARNMRDCNLSYVLKYTVYILCHDI